MLGVHQRTIWDKGPAAQAEYCREDICRLYALVEIVNEYRVNEMKVEPLHLYSIAGWHGWTSEGPCEDDWVETEHAWLRSVQQGSTRPGSTFKETIQRKLDAFRAQIDEERWKPEDATLDGARDNFMKKWRDGRVRADGDSDEDDDEPDYFLDVVTPWIWCQLVLHGNLEQPEASSE